MNPVLQEAAEDLLTSKATSTRVTDPRKTWGIRPVQTAILTIAARVVLSGMRSVVAMADWVQNSSRDR